MAKRPSKPRAKEPLLIPAVAYVRKSTAGIRPDGGERQEKSIPAQKAEIEKLARQENCKIIRWYEDPGKSGWKRGIERPEFDRMLKDARELRDFKVIIVDEADRFTRATWRKAVIDIDGLNDAGVEKIISAKDGVFDIADEHDAGEAHRLIAIAMGNHEFCRKLSRRVARGLRDRAREGKRAGGVAPYGMENVKDERGKVAYLKHGDRKHLAVVRRIFNTFVRRDWPACGPVYHASAGDTRRQCHC